MKKVILALLTIITVSTFALAIPANRPIDKFEPDDAPAQASDEGTSSAESAESCSVGIPPEKKYTPRQCGYSTEMRICCADGTWSKWIDSNSRGALDEACESHEGCFNGTTWEKEPDLNAVYYSGGELPAGFERIKTIGELRNCIDSKEIVEPIMYKKLSCECKEGEGYKCTNIAIYNVVSGTVRLVKEKTDYQSSGNKISYNNMVKLLGIDFSSNNEYKSTDFLCVGSTYNELGINPQSIDAIGACKQVFSVEGIPINKQYMVFENLGNYTYGQTYDSIAYQYKSHKVCNNGKEHCYIQVLCSLNSYYNYFYD